MDEKEIQNPNKKSDQKKVKKKSRSSPLEMSTSKPGGAYDFISSVRQPKMFDPRFQSECGEIDQISFVRNYAFLQDNRKSEIQQINQKLKRSRNPEEAQALKRKKQSLEDQFKTFDAKQKDAEDRFQWHIEEKQRILEGKKPFWLDKSSMREREEQRKFKQLKESGKLNKYFIKKRKKMAQKDKLNLM
ncbi:rRNA biogenesis protein rrp36 [Tritrichomonas musculus]|uniref:rRNA biogenesis protein RRP36 n=1 Tax=Tritrichomonas musculus TaxID=1915356 RepID=A0ABR2KS51_9EUKA